MPGNAVLAELRPTAASLQPARCRVLALSHIDRSGRAAPVAKLDLWTEEEEEAEKEEKEESVEVAVD